MTLHEHRGRFEERLSPFVEWCARRGISPNVLTTISLLCTIASAVGYYLSSPDRWWLLAVASAVLAIAATLDSADGVLARTTGQASALGDYLDHAFDRFADVILLLGFTFSPWVSVELGLFAIVGTLLTSYMGTQAQAVGVGRDYGGLLGRADRLFLLTWLPVLEIGFILTGYELPWGLTLIWLGIAWIAVAGNITAIQRFWASYRELSDDEA